MKSDWKPPSLAKLPRWSDADRVGLDIETRDDHLKKLGPGVRRGAYIIGVSFAIAGVGKWYLPVRHGGGGNLPEDKVFDYLLDQARDFRGDICGANLSYDLDFLAERGVVFRSAGFRDVQVAEPLLDENQFNYSLQHIARRHGFFGKDEGLLIEAAKAQGIDPKKEMWKLPSAFVGPYAEEDSDLPLRILQTQEKLIAEQGLDRIYELERKVLPVLIRMRRRGVAIDFGHLDKVEAWSLVAEQEMLDCIHTHTGVRIAIDEINKKGPLAAALDEMGVPYPLTAKAKQPQITKDTLMPYVDNPVVSAILHAKYVNKLRNTFVKSVREHATNGRIHATFNQLKRQEERADEAIGAGPGRLSCVPKATSEILTRRGWRRWDDLIIGEDVIGYNVLKKAYEWTTLKAVHDAGCAPVGMVKAAAGHGRPGPVSLSQGFYCTEDHRWVIDHPTIAGFVCSGDRPRGVRKLLMPDKPMPTAENSVLSDDQAFTFGWYLTDGWLRKSRRQKKVSMCVAVVKKRSIKQLKDWIARLGIPTTHHIYRKQIHNGDHLRNVHYFYFTSSYFDEIYRIAKSMSPEELVLSLSAAARDAMLSAMLEGDGSRRRGEVRYDRFGAVESHDKRTWEYFTMLAAACGVPYSPYRTLTKAGTPFLNFGLPKSKILSNRYDKWAPDHIEDVWCPETGTGTWVMRQGVRICVTGNSCQPNVQQQPGRVPDFWTLDVPIHKYWRKIYIPDDGGEWAAVDLSGQEPRMFVHYADLCDCTGAHDALVAIRDRGMDFHDTTTKIAFGVDKSTCDPKEFKRLRGISKAVFLGCLGRGTPVLTDKGYVPIEKVTTAYRLWDGLSWVRHDGVVSRGAKPCVNVNNVWMTPDHEILTPDGWFQAQDLPARSQGSEWCLATSQLLPCISANVEGSSPSNVAARVADCVFRSETIWCPESLLAVQCVAKGLRLPNAVGTPTASLMNLIVVGFLAESLLLSTDAIRNLIPDTAGWAYSYAEVGETIGKSFYDTSCHFLDGTIPLSTLTESTTTMDIYREIYGSSPDQKTVGTLKDGDRTVLALLQHVRTAASRLLESGVSRCFAQDHVAAGSNVAQIMETYDILNVGRNSRFQALGLIVSNSIYGMGGGKLCHTLGYPTQTKVIRGKEFEVAGPEGQAFLAAFHAKVPFLKQIKSKVEAVAKARGHIVTIGGRHIHYVRGAGNERKALNNLIQGGSADQVKMAMVEADAAGLRIQLQVHDEIDMTIWDRKEAQQLADIMTSVIEIGPGSKADIEIGPSWGDSMSG